MKNNNKGFSLIELSIVLIIMGLLVVGVTGGASLVKSAQLNSISTEFQNYRTAFNTYYAQFGKVPGSDADPSIVKDATSAFTDLYNENMIDKEPTTSGNSNYISSKFGKNSKWFLKNAGASFTVSDFSNLNILYVSSSDDLNNGFLTSQEASSIDSKLDDGKADSGVIRGVKGSGSSATQTTYTNDTSTRDYSLVSKLDF